MKIFFLMIILLASLFLTSCEKNNTENDTNKIIPNNQTESGNSSDLKTAKISYNDYVKQYGNVDNNINLDEETKEDLPTKELVTDIPANQLSTYSTPLLASSKERINNIEIVCDRLNDFILEPNATFSYNDVAGPYGPSDGFEEATILLSDGSKSKGFGGGVCQLSSTLYNVVKNIDNIEITERHHHSAPVAYVPKNEDATISLQSNLDFKFVNNNAFPIRFKAKCANGYVTVTAFKEN